MPELILKSWHIIPAAAAAIFLYGLFYSYPLSIHRSLPIKGEVVDATTRIPIEGAVVVAVWETLAGFGMENRGYLHIAEAVTDAKGRYVIPAWEPKLVLGSLDPLTPWLIFFKPGYHYHDITNRGHVYRDPPALLVPPWNSKTIKLTRFAGTIADYAREANVFDMPPLLDASCEWTKIPRYTAALIKLGDELRKQGLHSDLPTSEGLYSKGRSNGRPCPEPRAFLLDFLRD